MSQEKGEQEKVVVQRKTHRESPKRNPLPKDGSTVAKGIGINPEELGQDQERTRQLAQDQSLAARNLIYNPGKSALGVIKKCTDGMSAIMARVSKSYSLQDNEILISMVTRLMADGGTGRVVGFNDALKELHALKKQIVAEPPPEPKLKSKLEQQYRAKVESLAGKCRTNMAQIIANANKPGPEGAIARQGVLSFMGDLGGLETKETGFGAAYALPLTVKSYPQKKFKVDEKAKTINGEAATEEEIEKAKQANQAVDAVYEAGAKMVYDTYVAGVCDAQKGSKANPREVEAFEVKLDKARRASSMKGGALSAPAHTADKKGQRAPSDWNVQERKGLLNQGDAAEAKLKEMGARSEDSQKLRNASWPVYRVSDAVVEDVVEPVTGHISGTFGEMSMTMNMFCGTPPESITMAKAAGDCKPSTAVSIAALSSAGLITGGFHSAVEVFQPMSTFTTEDTTKAIGPKAKENMELHAAALREYADEVRSRSSSSSSTPSMGSPTASEASSTKSWTSSDSYALTEEECSLCEEELLNKAAGLTDAATKSQDMISLLQGGGTLATLEVSGVMANQSTNTRELAEQFSLQSQFEILSQQGRSTPELVEARKIAEQSNPDPKAFAEAIAKARDAVRGEPVKPTAMEQQAVKAEQQPRFMQPTVVSQRQHPPGPGQGTPEFKKFKERYNRELGDEEPKKGPAGPGSGR